MEIAARLESIYEKIAQPEVIAPLVRLEEAANEVDRAFCGSWAGKAELLLSRKGADLPLGPPAWRPGEITEYHGILFCDVAHHEVFGEVVIHRGMVCGSAVPGTMRLVVNFEGGEGVTYFKGVRERKAAASSRKKEPLSFEW